MVYNKFYTERLRTILAAFFVMIIIAGQGIDSNRQTTNVSKNIKISLLSEVIDHQKTPILQSEYELKL